MWKNLTIDERVSALNVCLSIELTEMRNVIAIMLSIIISNYGFIRTTHIIWCVLSTVRLYSVQEHLYMCAQVHYSVQCAQHESKNLNQHWASRFIQYASLTGKCQPFLNTYPINLNCRNIIVAQL